MNNYVFIDYFEDKKISSGIATESHPGKIGVVTLTGRNIKLKSNRILNSIELNVEVTDSISVALEKAKILNKKIEAIKENIDIAFLYEGIEGTTYRFSELASIYFGDNYKKEELAALKRKLFEDKIYFKIKDIFIEKREPEVVQSKLNELGYKSRILELLELFKNKNLDKIPEQLKEFFELLIDYLAEKRNGKIKKAVDVLKELNIKGYRSIFNFLVKNKIISEHEYIELKKLNVSVTFSEVILKEAEEVVNSVVISDEDRKLFEHESYTIDDSSTLCFDDAIAYEFFDDNKLRLFIHIADADQFVPKGSRLDKEARIRAISIFLPEYSIDMLPPLISKDKGSLVEGAQRPVISIEIVLNLENMNVLEYRFYKGLITVTRRLSYEEADKFDKISLLIEIAKKLKLKRMENGAVDMSKPFCSIELLKDGKVEIKVKSMTEPSRLLISEFMILANSLLGEFLAEKNLPSIFRGQSVPVEEVIEKETEGFDPLFIYKIRHIMERAEISTSPLPHFSLGVKAYAQFTSPLRRYSDLVNIRQLKEYLVNQQVAYTQEELMDIISVTKEPLKNAVYLERQRKRYWICHYLIQNKTKIFEGVVLAKSNNEVLVYVYDLAMEVRVRTSSSLDINEKISLKLLSADPFTGDIVFTKL